MSRQSFSWTSWTAVSAALVLSGSVLINGTSANIMPAGAAKGTQKATTTALGGPLRYLTSVSTDKPIYRGGDTVYIRGVLLNASTHEPMHQNEVCYANVQIKGPNGDLVEQGTVDTQDSVWGFTWNVPNEQPGGEYTASISYPGQGFSPAERKFDVRTFRAPRLNSQIKFQRDGYGPGEIVRATLDVKRAEGGVPAGAKVTVTANVDGTEIKGANATVDANGLCSVSIALPKHIARGEGTLALIVEDGGVVETASKTIPILLQDIDLQIYPEGGDLIAGFKNRVYIQANQPNGKPADIAGKLMSKPASRAGVVMQVRTEHEGRGRFEFVPEAGRDYFLTISKPVGIKKQYALPHVKTHGAVLRAARDVFGKSEPVLVSVGCVDSDCTVTLSKREVELSAQKIHHSHAMQQVSFTPARNIDGVLTVTVWAKDGTPLAERLVFREPAKPLKVTVTPNLKSYAPGQKVSLSIKTTSDSGKPVESVVGLTVTDESVLEMIDRREQAPQLPVMVYLEPEVSDLADAHVYLDPKNPKAPLATDLLLGTQGWRRFALEDVNAFIDRNGDKARRALAFKNQSAAVPIVREEGRALGVAIGAMAGAPLAAGAGHAGRLGGQQNAQFAFAHGGFPASIRKMDVMKAPAMQAANEMNQAQAARDMNFFQAEPQVLDERRFVPGDAERQQKNEPVQLNGRWHFKPNVFRIDGRQSFKKRYPYHQQHLVREFAHKARPDRKPNDREDFTQTVYWSEAVKTNKSGEAAVSFDLSDSVTKFRVLADAFSSDGAVGAASTAITAEQQFYAEAKMPLEVTAGDKILLPISLVNGAGNALGNASVNLDLNGDFKLQELKKTGTELASHSRVRWIQPITVGAGNKEQDLVLTARAGQYSDRVERKLSVKPKGFPYEVAFGGVLEPGKSVVHTINIPAGVVTESVASNTAVYPTPLANMTEALQRMIQDPNGCFEQTSSTSYPLTMAQQYFQSHSNVDPQLVEMSSKKLDAGYQKLVSFWCPDRGYEWFGQDPGHEALTAFGLLHFVDMSKVRNVDQNMVATTRAWLLKQKDGQGGFTRKRRALHTWIEDKDCSNAYIIWALLECGQPASDLKPELASLKSAAEASQNNYVVALAANAFYLSDDKPEAKKLMDKLSAKQKADGSVDGVKSSIVGSGGESLEVEGTSLATLAWLHDPSYAGNVEKSIKFLADSCKAGRYGSTQATVLALRSIVTYDKQRARPKAPGKVQIIVDGQSVGDWVAFNESTRGALKLPNMAELLTPGQHKMELRMEDGSPMPYSIAVVYNAITPDSDKECKLDLRVKLAQAKIVEGASTEADVTVINTEKAVIPNPVAIVGLPGGLEPRHDQLKELVKKGKIDAYEVRGREVVLYWRTLPASANIQIPISVIAAIPGTYTGPASRAYLYYTDEHKKWVDGLRAEIAAK